MQVIVKGRHTEVPDALKQQAVEKIQRVKRFFDRIQVLEIEFSEEHNPRVANKYGVSVTLTTKAHLLRASANGPDPAAAVDAVVAKLQRQVKRLKGKLIRRGSRAGPPNPGAGGRSNPATDSLESGGRAERGEADVEEEGWPRITRRTRFAVKPMTPEEAILQMETLGHDFYLFIDAESEHPGVVYRRRDGSFGLIEPD